VEASGQADETWGSEASWETGGDDFGATEPALSPEQSSEQQREWRKRSLKIHNSVDGSTGLIRIHEASSGAVGTFRLGMFMSYYSGSGFLCSKENPCMPGGVESPEEDDASHSAVEFSLSATPWPFLELFAGLHSAAAYNDKGSPQLLQALGDTNLGAKGFIPYEPDTIFSFGGEMALWLLNGTGKVGLDTAGTSFDIKALATADLDNRINPADRLPLRFHANFGYSVNNAGLLVEDTENKRNRRINRIERFGLGIDRVDFFRFGLGAEYVHEMVRPFLEWTLDTPFNFRTDYECYPELSYPGDGCLGYESQLSRMPSRLTLGARVTPWIDGFSATAALDVGTGATSHFIEEVAPEMPWNLYIGLGFAFDTTPEPLVREVVVEGPPVARPEPQRTIQGKVVDAKTGKPISDAIVHFKDRELTGMVTDADGAFVTGNLPPGPYTFLVSAKDYHDGECEVSLPAVPPSAGAVPAAPPPEGAPPPQAGMAAPQAAPMQGPPPPTGDVQVPIRCELKAIPPVGNVIGAVVSRETGEAIAAANVTITDKLGRHLELTASPEGAFRFENVPAGTVRINVSAAGYLPAFAELDISVQEDHKTMISLNPKPAQARVVVTAKEVKLNSKVHFQHDSAALLPDSMSLLQEVAQAINDHPEIRKIEVQGHTDNTGQDAYNLRLSQERAQAVVDALVKLGVEPNKLSAKGYGAEKPLVPNTNEAFKAKNRRVQLLITERD